MGWGLGLLGVSLVVNTVAGTVYTRRQIQHSVSALQTDVASLTARRMQSFIHRKLERLQDVAVSMSLYPLGSEEQRLLGLLLLKNDRSFTELSVVDADAMERLKFSERKLYLSSDLENQADSPKFQEAIQHGRYIGPVYTSDRAEPYMTLAVPLKATPSEVMGVVSAETNLKFLWEVIGESKFGFAGFAYVVDGKGDLIAHQDPSVVLKKPNLRDLPKVQDFLRNPAVDLTPGQEGNGIMGKAVLSTFAPVPELGWAVVLEEPLEAALGDLWTMRRYAFGLLGIGLVLGAAIIGWVSNKITRPIRELRKGVEIIGGGNLNHRTEVKTGDELEALAVGFNKMASALKDSYSTLEQKVEQRTQELSALYEVTTAVSQSLELDTILHAVIKKIKQRFRFEATRVFLFNTPMDELQLQASVETDPELWAQVRSFKLGEGVVGRVAESSEPIIFEDIENNPRYLELSHSKATSKAKCRFFAVFPIKTKSRTFGTLVFNGKFPRKLGDEEIQLITSMSEQLGVALEKTSLFEQVKNKSDALESLVEINKQIAALLDRESLLPRIAEEARRILKMDGANFRLLDGDYLVLAGSSDPHRTSFRSKLPLDTSLSGRVVRENRVVVVKNVSEDPTIIEEHRRVMRRQKYRTFIGVPLRVGGGRILGTINVNSRDERELQPEDIKLIMAFADQAAIAIENANLFAQLREKAFELETLNCDLREANRAKSEFMAAMSHELRTPLNVIIGNADLIRDGFLGELNPDQKRALEKIGRYSRMLLKLINDVLALSRIEAKRISLELSEVRVEEIIHHAQTHVEQINRDHRLEVCWDLDTHMPRITTDALKLEEILQNLIGNAFKFTPEGRIEVRVRNLQEAGKIQFMVADTGIGIEPENLGKIFNEFEQLKEAHTGNYQGVGLGLAIVKKYLELMQGEIRVESEPGRGSTFTFSLPHTLAS